MVCVTARARNQPVRESTGQLVSEMTIRFANGSISSLVVTYICITVEISFSFKGPKKFFIIHSCLKKVFFEVAFYT